MSHNKLYFKELYGEENIIYTSQQIVFYYKEKKTKTNLIFFHNIVYTLYPF